ncbi:unnamed protein product [Calypogeia fissa]
MAAASMASLTVTAALPGAVSCSLSSSSNGSAAKMSSSANMGGMRLHTVAAPSFSRSSRSLIVRAEEQGSFWDKIKSFFGAAQKEVSKLKTEVEKEVDKAAKEAKKVSGELGDKAEDSKEEAEVKAEEAKEEVADGIAELKEKVEDGVETARAKANN